jgi:hypothetical protein
LLKGTAGGKLGRELSGVAQEHRKTRIKQQPIARISIGLPNFSMNGF